MHTSIPGANPGLADLLGPELEIGLLAALGLVGVRERSIRRASQSRRTDTFQASLTA